MSFNKLLPASNPNSKNDWDDKDFYNTYDDLASDDLNVVNYPCPAGNYCPEGSRIPIPCPIGTYKPSTNGVRIEQCIECDKGFYCPCEG